MGGGVQDTDGVGGGGDELLTLRKVNFMTSKEVSMKDMDIFSRMFNNVEVTRGSAGPSMMTSGIALVLVVLLRDTGGVAQSIALGVSVILIIGGMVVTYVAVVKGSDAIVTTLPTKTEDLSLAVEQLARNYEWIRSQTMYAFFLSASFMALGLFVILLGSARSVLGLGGEPNNLTTIAGLIAEFISATSLVLYRSSYLRLNEMSARLHETWRILVAYELTKDLPETDRKDVTLPLIMALAGIAEPI